MTWLSNTWHWDMEWLSYPRCPDQTRQLDPRPSGQACQPDPKLWCLTSVSRALGSGPKASVQRPNPRFLGPASRPKALESSVWTCNSWVWYPDHRLSGQDTQPKSLRSGVRTLASGVQTRSSWVQRPDPRLLVRHPAGTTDPSNLGLAGVPGPS